MGLAALPVAATMSRAALAAGPVLAVVDQAGLVAPWSSAEFTFDLDGDRVPSIVIRLPDGRWYASSLICSHMKCVVRYFKDVAMARDTFDVVVDNPVLGCPCHFSVYDVANGGKVIAGPAPGPLLRLAVEARDGKLYITR
jgi:arsenite oxidase small subunit